MKSFKDKERRREYRRRYRKQLRAFGRRYARNHKMAKLVEKHGLDAMVRPILSSSARSAIRKYTGEHKVEVLRALDIEWIAVEHRRNRRHTAKAIFWLACRRGYYHNGYFYFVWISDKTLGGLL